MDCQSIWRRVLAALEDSVTDGGAFLSPTASLLVAGPRLIQRLTKQGIAPDPPRTMCHPFIPASTGGNDPGGVFTLVAP